MYRILTALVALLVLGTPAFAQKTKAQLTTEINTNYPDNTTQQITPSILRTTTTDQVNSYQQAPQVRAVAGVSDTLTVADFGNLVIYNNAGAVAVTIAQATGSFASFNVYVKNSGAGAVTITPTTSQINGAATLVLAQNQAAHIISDGTNYQLAPTVFAGSIFGSMVASGTITGGNIASATVTGGNIASSTVANSNLAAMTQNAVKGAATSTAPTDLSVPSCSAASSALTWTTNTGFGCNSISGAAVNFESGMRLTLTTGTPVLTSTVSAQTTVFCTPYKSQFIPLFDGTNMISTDVGGELSQLTTDTTKSPAAVAANSVYDVFAWNDGGTFRCTRGPLWTNDTTRSAGTALTRVKGVLLNNASITNGPAAQRGTYMGTFRSNGTSSVDYIFGTGSASGTAAFFGVWNMYNRVSVSTSVNSTVATWTYNLATIRAANNSTTMRVTAVFGLSEDGISASYNVSGNATAGGTAGTDGASAGLGLDVTNAYIVGSSVGIQDEGAGVSLLAGTWAGLPGLGVHFIQALENAQSAVTETFRGGTTVNQNALTVNLRN